MRLTVSQLRRIIKEEVSRVVSGSRSRRRLRESEEDIYTLEIPNVSVHADGFGMDLNQFLNMVKKFAAKHSVELGDPEMNNPRGYSEEYDSLAFHGSKDNLEKLADTLDHAIMGGAQSIEKPLRDLVTAV